MSTLLVVQASGAATSASLETQTNAWKTGQVTIDADQTGAALFSASKILPGSSGVRCLRVDYAGNVPADVRLWVDASGTLASSLLVTVEEGAGGSAADCTGFSPTATLFSSAPLASLASAHGDANTGLSSWSASGAQSRTYRIAWNFSAGNSAQGRTATATFHWTAQQS